MAALIGGGWCCSRGSGRSSALSGWRRCGGNRRAKIFGAHAHDRTIALNLNFAEAGLVQPLNKNRE